MARSLSTLRGPHLSALALVAFTAYLSACGDDDGSPSEPPVPEFTVTSPEYLLVDEEGTLVVESEEPISCELRANGNLLDDGSAPGDEGCEFPLRFSTVDRYALTLTVRNDAGGRRDDNRLVSVVEEPVFQPRRSGSIAVHVGAERFYVSVPDDASIARFDREGESWARSGQITSCEEAEQLTLTAAGNIVVSCPSTDALRLLSPDGDLLDTLELRYGAQPRGVLSVGDTVYCALQGTGELLSLSLSGEAAGERFESESRAFVSSVPDARGLALWPDGRILVAGWRGTEESATIALHDAERTPSLITLAIDPRPSADTETGGVPVWLDHVALSPTGRNAAVPALQANIEQGLALNGQALRQDQMLRAIVAFVDVDDEDEDPATRFQFDDRGLASSALYSFYGDYLYVLTRGSRTLERIDALRNNVLSGSVLNLGFAPEDLASVDETTLAVDASLSREVVLLDVSTWPPSETRLATIDDEPLDPEILRGKILFNDSFDTRLTQDSYIACAHCHLDGDSDRLMWDFTERGEGLRNTISLLGRGGTDHGLLHWTGNFDEVQDFEVDIRLHFGGTGLLDDEDWEEGSPLDIDRAGLSEDLDALAAYVSSLQTFKRSPWREPDGGYSEAAIRGEDVYRDGGARCAFCHGGESMTNSGLFGGEPRLFNVGTEGPLSGARLGLPLTGFDSPTLRGVFDSAPYLHDGGASTLDEVFSIRSAAEHHGGFTDLTEAQQEDLILFMLSLDGSPLP